LAEKRGYFKDLRSARILTCNLAVLGLTCLLLTYRHAAASADSTVFAIDPKARQILAQMQSAYSNINSLSEQVTAAESPDQPHRLVVHSVVKILRPAFLSVASDSESARSGATTVVANGNRCYVTAPQYPTRYLSFPLPATSTGLQTAASQNILSSLTINLFADPNFVGNVFSDDNLATLRLESPVKVDGVAADVLVLTDRNGVTLTFYLGRSDHLVRRVVAVDPNKPGLFTETYTSVKANSPLTSADFTFAPPLHTLPFYASSFDQAVQDPPD
jgi:outer membrane lipoprotein-sorting protein